jgi:D-alanyl-D-alanine endopeptidase (penicillin-binding protein 7)
MQRKLHPLEGIVAVFALFFVLAITIGFAHAQEAKAQKAVFLRSSSALVLDADTGEVVIDKNADTVTPIASITKLMTAMVILDRGLDLDQRIVVSREDYDSLKGTRSRLRPGNVLTRRDLLLLSLMASENRAASALGRTYPGGLEPFVAAMNAKAAALDMKESRFVDATGLSPHNVSSARDLVKLVRAAHEYELIREFSTRDRASVKVADRGRPLKFNNTNGLVRAHHRDVEL